jgi:hypothetical protein
VTIGVSQLPYEKRAFPLSVAVACVSIALATIGSVAWPPSQALPQDVPDVAPIESMVRWDAGWYGEIAANGYWYRDPSQGQSPVAYFPLYPMAIRAVTWLGVNRWVAGSCVSLFCALGALALFLRWARRVNPGAAFTAFLLLMLYPFAEYLYGVIYSDAMFLMMAVLAFLFLERGQPWWAAVFGAFATACRPVAPAIVIGLLVRSIELRRRAGLRVRFVDLLPGLSGLGLLSYMIFLGTQFHDPLAFAHVQGAAGWDQTPGWETWLKVSWFKTMFPRVAPLVAIRLAGHAFVTLCALALVVPTFKKLGWGYGVYCALVVGIPAVSSKDFQGLGRYVIAAFPLFVTMALLIGERPRLRRGVLTAFAVVLALLAFALGAGGYVA